MDLNDRALRRIIIGLGGQGALREEGFNIAVASEIMAILCLSENEEDLKRRLSRIVVAYSYSGKPIFAGDLKISSAMAVVLKDALSPNLCQTLEHTPVFIHGGPFANIAHGCNSVLATRYGLKLGDYLITEAGFGADLGAEKFFNIKCRISGLVPNAVVVVCSVRALKMHSGDFKVVAGKPLSEDLLRENTDAVERGACNLEKQIENMKQFGIPVVVAINKFTSDTKNEIEAIRKKAIAAGAEDAVLSEVWEKGGEGGRDLAKAVDKAANKPSNFKFLYDINASIKQKIETIATKIYGAKDVQYDPEAEKKIALYTKLGYDKLPLCMAKTHLSLSHDPNLKGAPKGFTLPVRDVRASVGAGFLYPLCGTMRTMPGLPSEPAGERIDLDQNGKIVGLF